MPLRRRISTAASVSTGGVHAISNAAAPPGPRASASAKRRRAGATRSSAVTARAASKTPSSAESPPFPDLLAFFFIAAIMSGRELATALNQSLKTSSNNGAAQVSGSSRALGTAPCPTVMPAPTPAAAAPAPLGTMAVSVTNCASDARNASGNSWARLWHARSSWIMFGDVSIKTCRTRVPCGKGRIKGSSALASALAISRRSLAAMTSGRSAGKCCRMAWIRRNIRRRFSCTCFSSSAMVRRNCRTTSGSACSTSRVPPSDSTTIGHQYRAMTCLLVPALCTWVPMAGT
mmetsp:Transcript_56797/g.164509  ORF Transcript_56797/g.164509 Transcript_56797/m.164509 type:complete len:290 (-) Transcript_56797:458-1327(-)